MRIRSIEQPPTKEDIDRIVQEGATVNDQGHFPSLLRRLRQSYFLNDKYQPLSARKRLVEQYKADGLVLFLGAGVSSGSGIPGWHDLAKRVLLKSGISPKALPSVLKALPSNVTQFELAAQRLENNGFLAALYSSLYERMECKHHLEKIPRKYEDQSSWSGWNDILKLLQNNKTLKAVGDLLIAEDDPPRRNPQIHAVLTFNADNLVELYCEAKTGGKRVVTLVDRASVGDHPDRTPVYHLHGTLDARGENFLRSAPLSIQSDQVEEISGDLLPDIVFRESEYYETIANPVSFVNHTPQSFLRRSNALFIGTSLDDLNMRRWLHDSFRERVQHRTNYLREFYWQKGGSSEHEARLESLRHFWLRTETELHKETTWAVPKEHVNKIMNNLGVQVIWCSDYADIQRCLHELRQQGNDPKFGRRAATYPT